MELLLPRIHNHHFMQALLEYERHKMHCGELPFSDASLTEPIRVENQVI